MALEKGTILKNDRLCADYGIYDMEISLPDICVSASPGQILHLACGEYSLRRPISICSSSDGVARICYEVRGAGTQWLSERAAGEELDVLGAYGKGFDVSDTSHKALLVGGGIGVYPLLWLAQLYGSNSKAALGFRCADRMTLVPDFEAAGCKVSIATDDGSCGLCGYSTQVAEKILDNEKFDIIYSCGPKVMMRGVAALAASRGIRCEVSMEERMGCGVGACLSCVCKVKGPEGMKRVCVDGPVFDALEIDWNV
ncbi:MAG: dihydroorotate dehydrogenase electron transfer subunit [Eubacteriales bacterium]